MLSEPAQTQTRRLLAVDALRGLIIVLMALDHANLFVAHKHSSGEYWGGPLPAYDSQLAFFTRFITHLAAPGFFFLMGAGMLLFTRSRRRQGWDRWAIVRHFWLRGALLIALQFLVVNRAWALSPGGWPFDLYVGVLYALGAAMVVGSLLIWLEPSFLLVLTGALLLLTPLIVPAPQMWGRWNIPPANLLLFLPGGYRDALGRFVAWSNYPVLPWLAFLTFGLVFGGWLWQEPRKAYRRGFRLGAILLVAFIILRWLNAPGNILPSPGSTLVDFLNVVKYPPSTTFALLTMGLNLILLQAMAWLGERRPFALQPLAVFGRAPLLFYVAHLFLYAGLGLLLTPEGTTIPGMMPIWLLGLAILYPLCSWFGHFKQRRPATALVRYF